MPVPDRKDLSRRCSPLNKPYYLGIDLGTSSVKGILRSRDGHTLKSKKSYCTQSPDAWKRALKATLAELTEKCPGVIAAGGLLAQVGTYLVNGSDVIPWQSQVGTEELVYLKSRFSADTFIREISMSHPDLHSYPLPRLLYIQKHYGANCQVLQPKDYLIQELTGQAVTDLYSMRGLANLKTCQYAHNLLKELDIRISLPELKRPHELAGYVTDSAAAEYGLPVGMPIYLGCNDFYAGLLGMGIFQQGDTFDLTGTSEHIGYISDTIQPEGFVSGGYFAGNCTYGGTKASGSSCDLAIRNFGIDELSIDILLHHKPPVFLPYLNGERAPVFDEKARGVYFGIQTDTTNAMLSYATLEGVAFSLYHIAQCMNMPSPTRLICGGGAAQNALLNTLKATLFDCPVVTARESDTSALGACMLAMLGDGCFSSLQETVEHCVTYGAEFQPEPAYRELLCKRFAIYQELYPALQKSFCHFYDMI